MAHRTIGVLVVVVTIVALAPATGDGQSLTARTVRIESAAFGGQATFAVLLPRGYDSSTKRYPVVYLLHGATQNHTAFPARSWFAKEVSRRELIVVMPHVPQITYTVRPGRHGSSFEEFIANDLVPYVDANYRTIGTRETRAIGGLSLGGFGAALMGVTHPELFSTVAAFGGAFTEGRDTMITTAMDALPADRAPFFYVACGLDDGVLPASRGFARLLMSHDIAHEYREVPGGHTWEVWDPQTLAFLDLLAHRPGFAVQNATTSAAAAR